MAKFTILMPTFNGRKYLERAIQSVISQKFSDWELLIIQDGGDEIIDIVAKFDDPRVKFFKEPHKGKAHALNVGLKKAEGEYIAYMDDDDIILSNHLSTLNEGLKKYDFVYTAVNDVRVEVDGGVTKETSRSVFGKETTFNELVYFSYIGQISVGHKKELLKKAGYYDEKLERFIDWNMITRLARIAEPKFIDEVTAERYWYYSDGKMLNRISGQASRETREKVVETRRILFEKNLSLLNAAEEKQITLDLMEKNVEREGLLADRVWAHEEIRTLREKTDKYEKEEAELLQALRDKEETLGKIVNSKSWRALEYLRSIRYPKHFLRRSFRLVIKIMKKILPEPIYFMLRKVFHKIREVGFELKLIKAKQRLQREGSGVLISVAIPIYDRTNELKIAIESVLNQDFQNFELILVTDGSPTETLELVRSYKNHPKVRIFEYPDNSGNSVRGRNKAILEARGKYLAFLDSDDLALPNRLGDTVALFEKEGADVVYGGYEFLVDGSREIKDIKNGQVNIPQEFTMDDLKKANYLFNSATAVRTEFVRKVGGFKIIMKYCEDYELWLRMLHNGAKFVPLKKPVIKYRVHAGNLELSFKEGEDEWIKLALEEYTKTAVLPKRVAYVLPTSGIGGGPAVVCEHANRLRKRGYDVTIIIDPVYEDKYDLSWFPSQSVPLIPLNKAFTEYDILIATGWTTAHTLKILNAKRKIYFVQSDERRFTDDKSTIERVNKTYKLDYEFMTEAKWIKKWLKEEFDKDASLVPNALNENIFYPVEPIAPKGSRLRVLLEGPIDIPFKGLADAFESVKDLDCEVWCVSSLGKPKSGWRCDKFFEKIPQSEMRKIYSSCDVLLKLSRVEGFFGPPLEMMACGGTAVVGNVTGYDEYIINEENALVVNLGDTDAAKNAIQRLIVDKKLLAKLKANGLKTAKEMNWEKSMDLLEKVINGAY